MIKSVRLLFSNPNVFKVLFDSLEVSTIFRNDFERVALIIFMFKVLLMCVIAIYLSSEIFCVGSPYKLLNVIEM